MMSRQVTLAVLTAASLVACREPAPPDPQLVAQWMRASLALARSERVAQPVAARISAYASLALYEGYAADRGSKLRSLAGKVNGLWSVPLVPRDRPVDGATVAAEAERVVLDSLFSEASAITKRTIDSLATMQIRSRRASGIGLELSGQSIEHGRALGRAILALAGTDGFLATRGRSWKPPKSVAQWTNTTATDPYLAEQRAAEAIVVLAGSGASAVDPSRASTGESVANRPNSLPSRSTLPRFVATRPTEPYWGTLRTFALRNGEECAPASPPAYSEQRGSDFWKMGRELYDSVSALTPEKREIVRFWGDTSAASGAPGFHWINAAAQMIARRRLTAGQAAEAYALTSLAIADAYVGSWKQKYRTMVVRPVTYVQRVFNPKWQAAAATPPFPEYPSEHAVLSGAAAEVLVQLLGDTIAFTDSTRTDIAPARTFLSFTQARDESAFSRVYAGVHFVPAVVNGLAQGQCIGQRVLGRLKTR